MCEMPIIEQELCTGCGLCVSVCYQRALVLEEDMVRVIETEECSYCTECEAVCPSGAIHCPYEIVIEDTQIED